MTQEESQQIKKASLPEDNIQCSAECNQKTQLITVPANIPTLVPLPKPIKKKKRKKPKNRQIQQYPWPPVSPLVPPFVPPPIFSMPHPDWSADYSYTPYENTNYQSSMRPPNWNTWRDNPHTVPYHRNHPYGFVDTPKHYPRHISYPSTSGFFNSPPPRSLPLKRKYPGLPDRAEHSVLNLRADISSQKVVIKWDPYPGRKDIFYKVIAVCTSSECNFQSAMEGNRWTFEQPFTQTQKVLTTTPGNVYQITVECKELSSKANLTVETKDFKACMNMAEHETMYNKAVAFAGHNMHFFDHIYRCKPKIYWDYIHLQNYDLMEKYIKDNNGQAANQINGRIHGLFFSARLAPDGTLPNTSPFGDIRMLIQAEKLLDPMKYNFYFADFYCNYITHYVTVVVCQKGSETDRFCNERCYKMDIFQNPFLKAISVWDPEYYGYRHTFYVSKKVWVEIYYTENIHLNIGRFSDIIATGAGTSKIGGLPNNKHCLDCNLYPIIVPNSFAPATVSKLNSFENDEDLNCFDVTVDEHQLQSSTLSVIFNQDKSGFEEIWDDLVEVVCSVIDGACEMQVFEQEFPQKGDLIEQSHREVEQLIKDTETDFTTNVIMQACPKLQEAWTAIKQHAENMKCYITEIDQKLNTVQTTAMSTLDIAPLSQQPVVSEHAPSNENS